MDSEEKVKGGERERGELMGQKLERGIMLDKRVGNSTPSPSWKYGLSQDTIDSRNKLSARKLGANLWEMQAQLNLRADKMSMRSGPRSSHTKQDNVFEAQAALSPSKQPTNGISLSKQIKPSLTALPNRRVEKVGQAQQPLSPASYCGSMGMAPHRATLSPNGSLTPNAKLTESAHSLKTSTELLKVLNRIWTLEEKHALDMSLVKTLKGELGQAQARIQELLKDKKRDQNEISNLTVQITELKSVKEKYRDRSKDCVDLAEEKLDNEINLRRCSEKQHLKLATELAGLKSTFSNALRELECEKRARALLEDLCDEFAKGIRDYEREVRLMKQNSPGYQILRKGENDRFILHISEAWLDELAQSKREDARDFSEKQSPLDKLCPEIEAFLQGKKSGKKIIKKNVGSPKPSGTFILNGPTCPPWDSNDEYYLSRIGVSGKGQFGNLTAKGIMSDLGMPRKGDTMQRSMREGRNSTNDVNLDREGTKRNSCFDFVEGSFDPAMFMGPSSPVKKWVSMVSAADPKMGESSTSRWSKGIKPNTLKAKLIEARLEGRQFRSRTSRSLSRGD